MTSDTRRIGGRLQWLPRFFGLWLEKAKMNEPLFDILVAIVIGVCCGLGAVALRFLIDGVHWLCWGRGQVDIAWLVAQPAWRRLMMPAVGGLVVGPIVYFFAREAKGHGVPEVMTAVAVHKGIIRGRVATAKAAASALTIGSGGSAGREGPIIQIGSAIGSWLGQRLNVSARKLRTFVACGTAAGIAATFNAPIAGALFSVEVILGEFGVAQFGPIVVSAVLATVIARHYFGGGPVFDVPPYNLVSTLEFLPYVLLGLLCGLVSVAFITLLYRAEDLFDGMAKFPEVLRPALGGICLGAIGLLVPHVYGDGYEGINLALHNQLPVLLLAVLVIMKVLATSLTLGSGGSGGIFAPSLFMGAMLGGALGHGVAALFGDSAGAAGGYALVAMGGVVAGTTHAPITAILIIFEITNNYAIILPLMVVCITSTVLARVIRHESIYTLKLVRKGIDLFRGRSMDILKTHTVSDYVAHDIESFSPGTSVKELIDHLIRGEHYQFYITTEDDRFFGVVSMSDLRRILMHREGLEQVLLAEDVAHERVPVCYPDENLSQALLKFEGSGLLELPVIENDTNRKLLGVLRYTEVFAVYNEEIMKIDAAEGLVQRVRSSDGQRRVKLAEGFSIVEWDPPASYCGQTLAQVALPARYNVRVMIVRKRGARVMGSGVMPEVPGPNYIITEDDRLLIYGRDEDLTRVEKL